MNLTQRKKKRDLKNILLVLTIHHQPIMFYQPTKPTDLTGFIETHITTLRYEINIRFQYISYIIKIWIRYG